MIDKERIIALSKQGFPVALAPAQMLAMLEAQQQMETELAELKQIAANLASTGAMAVGALPNRSPVAEVLAMAIRQYNEHVFED